MWSSPLAVVQALAPMQAPVGRIATAQIVMVVGITIWTLVLIGIGVTMFLLYRSIRRLIAAIEAQVQQLAPKAAPLLAAAGKVADDATEVSGAVRGAVRDVLDTVDELNHRLRALATDAEDRVRRLGAVLEVVQDEAEDVLLDAAATARGLHATAEALQRRSPRGIRQRRG